MNNEATIKPLPIFVYGTLMIGQPNDDIWQDCVQSVESATIDDCCLYDFGYYPVMMFEEGGRVLGQLVRLKKECCSQIIQDLDYLEGFDPKHPEDSNFQRVQVRVSTHNREDIEAWAYFGTGIYVENLPPVENGDWAKHIAVRWKDHTAVLDDSRHSEDSKPKTGAQTGVDNV